MEAGNLNGQSKEPKWFDDRSSNAAMKNTFNERKWQAEEEGKIPLSARCYLVNGPRRNPVVLLPHFISHDNELLLDGWFS
jgi:hypothetical protein